MAGKRKGLEDTRGTLFFEAIRIVNYLQPKFFIFENVKGLLSDKSSVDLEFAENLILEEIRSLQGNGEIKPLKEYAIFTDNLMSYLIDEEAKGREHYKEIEKFAREERKSNKQFNNLFEKKLKTIKDVKYYVPTFNILLQTISEIGYDCQWQLLNSKDFGVPQNRERVFVIGNLRGEPRREIFPIERTDEEVNFKKQEIGLIQVGNIDQKGHNSIWGDHIGISATINAEGGELGAKTGLYTVKGCSLRTRSYAGKPQSLEVRSDNLSNAVTTIPKDYTVLLKDEMRIRRLSPLEAFRLQGFPDSHHNNAKNRGLLDVHLYRQAGNAVTVDVVYEIARRI